MVNPLKSEQAWAGKLMVQVSRGQWYYGLVPFFSSCTVCYKEEEGFANGTYRAKKGRGEQCMGKGS